MGFTKIFNSIRSSTMLPSDIENVSLKRIIPKINEWNIDTVLISANRNCTACKQYNRQVFSLYGKNNKLASKIVDAIQGIQIVSMTAARLKPTKSKESFSDERLEKYLDIIQKADPTIRDIKVSFEEEELARQKIEIDDFENREIIATKTTVGVDTAHAVYENGEETSSTPISFFAEESLGTVKLFTALPYLFDVLESGGILFIDEIENGLHLLLAKEIIKLFINEETNPHHAQLICTSHQPLLVSGNFRRDQVWVTSKDNYGKSTLHRLNECKTSRAKVNLVNRLLEGAFGCNPDMFFESYI